MRVLPHEIEVALMNAGCIHGTDTLRELFAAALDRQSIRMQCVEVVARGGHLRSAAEIIEDANFLARFVLADEKKE